MNSLRKRETDAPSPFHAPGGHAVLEIALDAPKVIADASGNGVSIWGQLPGERCAAGVGQCIASEDCFRKALGFCCNAATMSHRLGNTQLRFFCLDWHAEGANASERGCGLAVCRSLQKRSRVQLSVRTEDSCPGCSSRLLASHLRVLVSSRGINLRTSSQKERSLNSEQSIQAPL